MASTDLDHADTAALLQRHADVLELIARAAPVGETLGAIIGTLEQLAPQARCSVLLLDRERGTLHHGAAPSLPEDYCAAIDGMSIGDGQGSCGTAAWSNRAVVAEDVRVDPRWTSFRDLAERAGLRACWSTPITGVDGMGIGTFAVYHDSPHVPSDRERALVERCTHLAAVAIGHDALHRAIVESEERFRRAFEDSAVGTALIGLDRRVERTNRGLRELVGERPGGPLIPGTALGEEIRPPDEVGTVREVLDRLERGEAEREQFEGWLRLPGADPVPVETTLSVIHGHDGRPVRFGLSMLDVSARRAAHEHEQARRDAEVAQRLAERHGRAKSELLTAVSHELRTPVDTITSYAELLSRLQLDDERRRDALTHVTEAAGHVLALVDEVLDLSRIEAGELPLELTDVSLPQLVAEVAAELDRVARARSVTLTQQVDGVVRADPTRLRQVVHCLLDNAIRHGRPAGRVAVRSTTRDDAVELSVRDDGPGIRPDLLPRIFTRFEDLTAAERQVGGGLGLGLVLAHQLARAMGGDLVAEDAPGGGAQLRLRLPVGG